MTVRSTVRSTIKSSVGLGNGINLNNWQTIIPPTIPSISGITLRALWQAPYGTPTTLKDAVGNFDLTVNSGSMVLVNNSPSEKPAIYFDGTLELINNSLTQCGICLFFRPADDGLDNRDVIGFGSSTANSFSLVLASDSVYPLRNASSSGNTAAPVNQWFCALIADGTGTPLFANIGGQIFGSGAAENRTGFSLGGRYPGGSTGTRFKGWFLGGCAFVTPDTTDFSGFTTKMKALMRHWFNVGAKPSSSKNLLVVSGDSIGVGYGLEHSKTPIGLLQSKLSGFKVYGTCVNGFQTSSNITVDVDLLDPSYSSLRSRNMCVLIGEPSNQIAYGGTGAQALTSVQDWGTARKAAGFEVIVCTCMDRNGFDATMNTHKATYNSGIRSAFNVATSSPYVFKKALGTTWGDLMVDLHLLNPTTFDGIHPDSEGSALISEEVRIAIENLDRVLDPIISSPTKRFSIDQSITISCNTPGASIYYTLDGTTPTASSTLYTSAIPITATTTVKSIAIKSGLPDSLIVTRTYTKVESQVVNPNWAITGTNQGGTVVGNIVNLGGSGENGTSNLIIDATEDFEFVAKIATAPVGAMIALSPTNGTLTWGGATPLYGGLIFPIVAPTYNTWDVQRIETSGVAGSVIENGLALPFWARIRKVDNDVYFDTSLNGTTWVNKSKRLKVLKDVTTAYLKIFGQSYGTIEAWLERLI